MTTSRNPSSRTILGALTSTFVPPASCSAAFTFDVSRRAYLGAYCAPSLLGTSTTFVPQDNVNCWPARSGAAIVTPSPTNSNGGLFGWGFYSPGLLCPTGYTTACSATGGGTQNFQFQFSILSAETAMGCCPSGFSCTTNQPGIQTCYQLATSTTFQAVSCSSTRTILNFLTLPNIVTVTTTQTGPTPTVLETLKAISSYTMYAPLIQINFQSSDIANSTTLILTNTASVTSSTSSPSSTAPQASTSRTGLGVGAKAGIGIGAALGFVLLALLGFFVYKRRAGYTRARQDSPDIKDQLGVEVAQGTKGEYTIGELPASERTHELHDHAQRAEMG